MRFRSVEGEEILVDGYVRDMAHVSMRKDESPADVEAWLQREAASLWPALLGSLSLRRAPCVRENCQACASGEQHQSYVLYTRVKGRRRSIYVPEDLVPEVRRSLENGRALQDMLQAAAPRYLKALKQTRDASRNDKD